ncbi:envelope biogenesis factor ElyC [Aliivibrio kagoshimensis]|uniref:envelope biogenesis factor ElyC n=1 Tax=Aliivibrio kagoshimensis TaxID=2910230 RepID=UPI003D0CD4C3
MFELKKTLSSLLMPLPALLIIGILGLLLLWFTQRKTMASCLLSLSILGLFVLSFQPFSTSMLKPLEREFPTFLPTDEPIEYIMVLGNGHVVDDEISPVSELSRAALMRLVEAIRIYRMYPGARLILSGYDGGSSVSHARMMAKVALSLGVTKQSIVLLETARDTWEEARQAAVFVQNSRMVLVTSASHMPRAMYEFRSAGIEPIPAPTNYLAHSAINQPWERYFPKALYLEQSERYWYEKLGQWWQQMRDSLSDANDMQTEVVEIAPQADTANIITESN